VLTVKKHRKDIFLLKYNKIELEKTLDNLIHYYKTKEVGNLSFLSNKQLPESEIEKEVREYTKNLLMSVEEGAYRHALEKITQELPDSPLLKEIKQVREEYSEVEAKIYFIFVVGLSLISYLLYISDLYYQQFVPIISLLVVLSLSYFFSPKMVIKLGILLGFINLLIMYPLKEILIDAKYSYIIYVFVFSIILGVVCAFLPRIILSLTAKSNLNLLVRLSIGIFSACLLFMFLPGVGDYLFHKKIQFHILEIIQPILVTAVIVQAVDIFIKYEKKDVFKK